MLTFRDITPADKEAVQRFTLNSQRQNCDLSFANLCSWRFLYQTQLAFTDDFLVLRFYVDGALSYMMPVGEGDPTRLLALLEEDAHRMGHPFQLSGVCEHTRSMLEQAQPGRLRFSTNRDLADYLYRRTDLAELKGKRYQAKRNHVNRFERMYPHHVYRPLGAEQVDECLALESQWMEHAATHGQQALADERRSLTYALRHFDELDLTGGALYVDGHIVAFTFGSPVNAHTFDVCIEKADTRFDGVYSAINQQFALHLPEQYVFLNREEDLGIEGLRKSKLSYHPESILMKYTAILADE